MYKIFANIIKIFKSSYYSKKFNKHIINNNNNFLIFKDLGIYDFLILSVFDNNLNYIFKNSMIYYINYSNLDKIKNYSYNLLVQIKNTFINKQYKVFLYFIYILIIYTYILLFLCY